LREEEEKSLPSLLGNEERRDALFAAENDNFAYKEKEGKDSKKKKKVKQKKKKKRGRGRYLPYEKQFQFDTVVGG